MDFDGARRAKWERGRVEYGGNGWQGAPPLEEMADEFLDEANYAEEAMLRGEISEDECAWFTRRAHEGWMAVQTILHREADECEYVPPTVRVSCGSM